MCGNPLKLIKNLVGGVLGMKSPNIPAMPDIIAPALPAITNDQAAPLAPRTSDQKRRLGVRAYRARGGKPPSAIGTPGQSATNGLSIPR